MIVTPLTLLLVSILLYTIFGSVRGGRGDSHQYPPGPHRGIGGPSALGPVHECTRFHRLHRHLRDRPGGWARSLSTIRTTVAGRRPGLGKPSGTGSRPSFGPCS